MPDTSPSAERMLSELALKEAADALGVTAEEWSDLVVPRAGALEPLHAVAELAIRMTTTISPPGNA